MIVGFTCGAFDLLHAGHIHFLEQCRTSCDELWIGLHTDPTIDRPYVKEKPIQSMYERYIQLAAVKGVSTIIPYDTENDLENMMGMLPIHKRFVGTEYSNIQITGQKTCESRGIFISYIPRLHTYSSSDLRARVRKVTP